MTMGMYVCMPSHQTIVSVHALNLTFIQLHIDAKPAAKP